MKLIRMHPSFRSVIITVAFLCVLSAIFSACSTDFEIEAGGRDIPVVYGFIDLRDTAHYIRVERAFLSGSSDAARVAQNVDSLYYDESVIVTLEKVGTGEVFPLVRVDGEQEGYPREDGPFAESPNILYKVSAATLALEGGEQLRLSIDRGSSFPPAMAETTILSPVTLVENLPPSPFSLGNYLSTRRIAWRTEPEAEIFDLRMLIHYREPESGNPGVLRDRTLEWVLSPSFRREDDNLQVNFTFLAEAFYQFIGASLEPLESGRRTFTGLDIQVSGGGPEFTELLTIAQANTGITSGSDAIPVYTNIREGRGIFSSRTGDLRTNIQLQSVSLDSLRNGIYTGDLGF